MKTQKHRILFSLIILTVAILAGCHSYPSKDEPLPTGATYTIAGATVIDPNRDTTIVLGTILKDSVPLTTAKVVFGLDSLTYRPTPFTSDSVYARMFTVAGRYAGGSYQFVFADSAAYSDTMSLAVPSTFALSNIVPTNRLVNGSGNVTLDWSGAANATEYVIASIMRGQQYTGNGYSQYSATGATAATFQADAFYPTHGTLPDTGWYDLYVYAIAGAPDSMLTKTALPIPLPSQLTDNISGAKDTGHWGAVRVMARDSVHVVAQP